VKICENLRTKKLKEDQAYFGFNIVLSAKMTDFLENS
jgi:hypothetical protein